MTEVWPDADTGKLVNLASAFGAFGDAVSAARQAQLADTMSSFDTYVSSEVSAATAYVDELSDNMNALANHAHDLRDSVNEFVKYVSHSTSEVIETLEEMLFTLGGGLVLSALLAPETGGASLGGDGLASAGEVASAASRVNTILQELRGLQFFKYASGGWEALNDLDKTAESTSIVRTLAGKVGVGLVKGGYKGAYVYGPVASIATLAITSDPREAVTTEIASVAGGLGGGVLEGFGDGGSDLLGTAAKKASAAAGSATTGAEELGSNDAVPVGTGVPSTKGGAPVAPAGRTLAPSDRGVLGKFLTPGGKVGGAVAGTLIELKIENKLTGQDFAMDFSEDLLRNSVEKDKVLVVVPKVAAVG